MSGAADHAAIAKMHAAVWLRQRSKAGCDPEANVVTLDVCKGSGGGGGMISGGGAFWW